MSKSLRAECATPSRVRETTDSRTDRLLVANLLVAILSAAAPRPLGSKRRSPEGGAGGKVRDRGGGNLAAFLSQRVRVLGETPKVRARPLSKAQKGTRDFSTR